MYHEEVHLNSRADERTKKLTQNNFAEQVAGVGLTRRVSSETQRVSLRGDQRSRGRAASDPDGRYAGAPPEWLSSPTLRTSTLNISL